MQRGTIARMHGESHPTEPQPGLTERLRSVFWRGKRYQEIANSASPGRLPKIQDARPGTASGIELNEIGNCPAADRRSP